MTLKSLDALCVAAIIRDEEIAFGWGGNDYVATPGPRDSLKDLAEGGWREGDNLKLMVALSAFNGTTPPVTKDVITVCLDSDGVPCGTDREAIRKSYRVQSLTRACAAITYNLSTANVG